MNKNLIINGQIVLYGTVGAESIFDDAGFFTDEDVAQALAEVGPRDVIVRLNSGGGLAFMGMAIYSLLKAHAGKVTIVVDGVAASAASLIAMAGAVREMRQGAMLMIHDPATRTAGPAKDHEDAAKNLNILADSYAAVYALASGKDVKLVREQMLATTWLTAKDAVAQGYATKLIEDEVNQPIAAFDYAVYANAPAEMLKRAGELRARMSAQSADGLAVNAAATRMRMLQAAAGI